MAGDIQVQEKPATDIEARVALSLIKNGWTFEFQSDFFGGQSIRGGIVVDFIVYTAPLPTPLWVNGEYFHNDQAADKEEFSKQLLYGQFREYLQPPITVWGDQLLTQEMSDQTIYEIFGRN